MKVMEIKYVLFDENYKFLAKADDPKYLKEHIVDDRNHIIRRYTFFHDTGCMDEASYRKDKPFIIFTKNRTILTRGDLEILIELFGEDKKGPSKKRKRNLFKGLFSK